MLLPNSVTLANVANNPVATPEVLIWEQSDLMQLARPDVNVVANLLAIDPTEATTLYYLSEIAKLRARTGRRTSLRLMRFATVCPSNGIRRR